MPWAAPWRSLPIGLGAGSPHRGALAAVQGAELDAGVIGAARHDAAECVDLADQVALADAADRRVAAHLPERVDAVGEQQRAGAPAGGRQGGFGAGMAAADDDHVENLRKSHGIQAASKV